MILTQQHLADSVGVDRSTVSLCFSNPAKVKPATRERVMAAAEKLGYRPHAGARATRHGRFGTVGLLQATIKNHGYLPAALVTGIQDALAKHGLVLTLAKLPDIAARHDAETPRLLAERAVDGLLVNYTHHAPSTLVRMIEKCGSPAVWLNTRRSRDCVYPDSLDAGDRLTRHLIDLGHTRIAYATADFRPTVDPDAHFTHLDRLAGYQRAMQRAGLMPRLLDGGDAASPDLYAQEGWPRLLRQPDRPTAVVGYFANATARLLPAVYALGLVPGRDLSIATFALPEHNVLADFTAMLPPHHEMGARAVHQLISHIEGHEAEKPTVALPYRLHLGRTTGPPPNSCFTGSA